MRRLLPTSLMGTLVLATGLWIWYALVTMPPAVSLPLTAPHVVGIWGPEGDGAWSNGDARMRTTAFAALPWRRVTWMWRQQSGDALQVTLTSATHTLAVTTTAPVWRRVYMLLPTGTTQLMLQSTTMRVDGDRRDLGPFITGPKITALAPPPWFTPAWAVDVWLPCVALLWWLWRGRWWGVVAGAAVMSVYAALVWVESRTGMQNPTLWLDTTGRYLSTLLICVLAWRDRYWHPTAMPTHGRRLGLDVMRAIAVLCVVFAHTTPLLFAQWSSTPALFRWTLYLGAVGVNIFFALSGYLIGGILWRLMPVIHQSQVLVRFWMRRWLRTLPAAYVSAIVVWFVATPQHMGEFLASIAFVGTFNPWHLSSENTFWWSLATEELFYLLFPLLLFVLAHRWRAQSFFLGALLLFAMLVGLGRLFLLWFLPLDVVGNSEIVSYARLDSLVWGVLVQWVRRHNQTLFQQLARIGFAPGLVMMLAGVMMMLDQTRWYYVALMCGHTLITAGAALLIPAFEHLHTVGWNALDRLFVGIALVSYSAYLYHTMMETWLVRQFGSATSWPMLVSLVIAYLLLTFGAAWLSYRWVEVPLLRWRDRHYPDHD
jgi:peptidoglycan/LPS O-acetylase OafA/YrhL